MDFFDFLSFLPLGLPGGPSRGGEPNEQFAAAIGCGLFPIVDFSLVLFASLYRHPALGLVVLPAALTAASVLVSRLVGVSGSRTLVTALGCGALCAFAGLVAALLGVFVSFFSEF
jgi:hypothetical protein